MSFRDLARSVPKNLPFIKFVCEMITSEPEETKEELGDVPVDFNPNFAS